MVVASKVSASLVKALETPSAKLSRERSELGLAEEFGDYFVDKELLVENFPSSAVRLIVIEKSNREYYLRASGDILVE